LKARQLKGSFASGLRSAGSFFFGTMPVTGGRSNGDGK
jgi:hypothetical protein